MTHDFDKEYWEQHWRHGAGGAPPAMESNPPNPYLIDRTSGLTPGTALDAGCGAGAEAIWLAGRGWQVTAADISSDALGRGSRRAMDSGISDRITWVEADLTKWSPSTQYDLVTTHYAHPAMEQLAFYQRISSWVAPGGTLLVVGHLNTHEANGHRHPPAVEVTAAEIAAVLDDESWDVVAAEERTRALPGRAVELRDAVLQATRRVGPNSRKGLC